MSELRRILISSSRLKKSEVNNNIVELNKAENHYLARVLRLRDRGELCVVDGIGHSWKAEYIPPAKLFLSSNYKKPFYSDKPPHPKICLAVVVPKYGFDEVIRMSCEIGVDILQPIYSERSVVTKVSNERINRWESIINEAVEQSERMWKPELRQLLTFSDCLSTHLDNDLLGIATTRKHNAQFLSDFVAHISRIDFLWVYIGPEGGWTKNEIELSRKIGCVSINLGETILRTSTAAIIATNNMMNWRRSIQ